MFGEEMNEINHEITNAVGELTNMISEQARKELEEIGKEFNVSGKTVKKYCMKWGIKIPAHGSWIRKKS